MNDEKNSKELDGCRSFSEFYNFTSTSLFSCNTFSVPRSIKIRTMKNNQQSSDNSENVVNIVFF